MLLIYQQKWMSSFENNGLIVLWGCFRCLLIWIIIIGVNYKKKSVAKPHTTIILYLKPSDNRIRKTKPVLRSKFSCVKMRPVLLIKVILCNIFLNYIDHYQKTYYMLFILILASLLKSELLWWYIYPFYWLLVNFNLYKYYSRVTDIFIFI